MIFSVDSLTKPVDIFHEITNRPALFYHPIQKDLKEKLKSLIKA